MAPREKLPPIHPGELLRDELNGRKGVGVKGSDGFCPPSAPFTDSPNNPNPPSHKGLQPFSTLRAPLPPALCATVRMGSGAGPRPANAPLRTCEMPACDLIYETTSQNGADCPTNSQRFLLFSMS